MHWSPDRNAGFSKANPQKLYLPVIIDPEYNYESINVENQEYNHSSLLWWMRRVIAMRKGFKAFSRGSIQFLLPNNHRILAFIRKFEEEILLVVINLSRFSQAVELDLSEYAGYVPEEAFSGNKFPVIRESPYVLTMGFNDYFWFLLKRESDFSLYTQEAEQLPSLSVSRDWEHFFQTSPHHKLENIVIPPHLRNSRWFAAKARTIRQVRILENIPLKHNQDLTYLLFIDVHYTEGASERYTLPLSLASGELESRIRSESPQALLAQVETKDMEGVLYDGMFNPDFQQALFKLIMHRQTIQGQKGALSGLRGKQLNRLLGTQALPLRCKPLKGEQSNTSILYGDTFIFKLYRKLEEGLNPDAEINRFLTDKTQFDNIPPFAGEINYREQGRENAVLGLLQGFVPNEGDAWTYTLDAVERFFDQIQVTEDGVLQEIELPSSYLQVEPSKIPESLLACIGGFFFEMISLLGKRTAEMHLALTEHQNDPNFAPEPFSKLYQRSVYQSMRYLVRRSMQGMQQNLHFIPQANQQQAQEVLNQEGNVLKRLEKIAEHKIETVKIRIHGDYHLGQVLFTGKDFLIIDFEGEPARPMSERRLKRSPIRDLAGMLRSFHYAIYTVYYRRISVRPESAALLQKWLEPWHRLISGVYLRSYLDTAQQASFIPARTKDFEVLLQAYLLEKAVYELGYELNNRPDWAIIPLLGIESILNS
jgi:maltose alpha-D-glucosyltransferase/alpha-amylase